MIAGCIERMTRNGCDGCERHDACASLLANLFGSRARPQPAPRARERPREPRRTNPFLTFLGEVARAVEEGGRPPARSAARYSPFRREVEAHVEQLLPAGAVRIDKVAREMGCSRQTLYRRLKAEGITFEQLLDDLRRRLALRLVREPGLSVKEIAYRLGFSEPAAFSRAFKRWTGRAPRAASRRQSG